MARLPNRQFGVGGGIAPDPLAPIPIGLDALKQNSQWAKDALESGFVAEVGRQIEVEREGWRPATVDFDPTKNIPAGYEAEGQAFMRADGPDQIELIRRQVDDNRALNKRRSTYNSGALLAGDLLAELTNPLNYLPVPAAVGRGLLGGAARVGGANVVSAGGQEAIRQQNGLTSAEESLTNIAFAGGLGATFGGVVGKVTTKNLTGAAMTSTRMPMPTEGGKVGSRFGPRVRPRTTRGAGSADHKGVDIKLPAGSPVKAPLGGRVVKVTREDGKNPNGNSVTIDHGNGVVTKYLHLQDFDVAVGSTVLPGARFGRVGTTGNSSGPHLHWQMEVGGKAVDPLTARLPDGVGGVATPAHATDALVGAVVPDVIDLPDGRAVPVVFGPTGNGAVASMRRARPRADIVDELTGLQDLDAPRTRMAPDGDEVEADAPGLDFDRLINPDERFSNGRPLSKTALLGMFDDRLKAAEKKGALEPDWMAQQRALVEAAYGEPDLRIAPDHADVAAAQRRAAAAADPRRYEGEAEVDRVLGEASSANAGIQSRRLMARADGLFDWAEDALRLFDTPERKLSRATYQSGPRTGQRIPYTRVYLEQMKAKALIEMQRAEDALDEVSYVDASVRWDEPSADTALDEGLAEIRQQDRDQRARDMDSGELADDLPFGRNHAGEAGVGMDGDHIVFDMEAAIRSYSAKPWTQSNIEGVDPLPDDAFPTMKDWVDFVMLHEIEHGYNLQRTGESQAAYENRIVKRALEQQRANKGSARVEGGVARLQSIKGTPIKDVLDRVLDPQARIHASIQQLGSDGAMYLESNSAGGTPIAPGGSVFQRAHMWMREVYLTREAIRSGYLESLGYGDIANRLGREATIIGQRVPLVGAKSRGQMSLNEFRAEVTRAQVGFDDVMPEAAEAARVLDAGFVRMEAEARAQGLFAGQKESRIAAGRKRSLARQFERDADQLAHDPTLEFEHRAAAERLNDEADALEARSFDQPVMPYAEPRYFPRMWNVAAIEADRPRLEAILAEAYRRTGHPQPELAATGAIDLITLEPTGAITHAPGSPNSTRHRDIPVANREVFDFIVQDPEIVTNGYYRRMGAALEMTRSFGDASGLDELDALRLDLRRRGVSDDDALMALQRWMDVRDRIAGGFHGANPLSLGNRAARALKNFASISVLGRVALSQIGDPIKAVLVQGLGAKRLLDPNAPAGMIQGLAAFFDGDVHKFNIGGPAKLSGEAFELALARAASRFIEDDDAIFVGKQTWVEKKLAGVQAPFGVANLLAPITTIVKEATGMIAAHNILKDASIVAEAIQAGGVPNSAAVKRLARNGIDPLDAQLLATMPVEMSERGLVLPNIMAWDGEGGERARRLVLGAVSGEVRRSIITPGPLERPRWFDGIVVTKGAVKKSFADLDAIERRVDGAQDALRALRGRPDDDEARMAAQSLVDELKGERYAARRNLGRNARTELPLLSLPAQLHSFAMSSGPKTLHGLFGEGDRNKIGGLLAMVVGGLVVARLKTSNARWEEMDWDARLMASVDNSGLTAIFGDVAKGIDAGLNLGLIPNNERDPEGKTIADEAGQFGGAATGAVIKMVNAVAGVGDDDFELWKTMRQLPGFSIFYVQHLLDGVMTTFSPTRDGGNLVDGRDFVADDGAPVAADPARPGRAMLDPAAPLGAPANWQQPDMGYLPAGPAEPPSLEAMLAQMDPEARAAIEAKLTKRKGRKPRVPRAVRSGIAELL